MKQAMTNEPYMNVPTPQMRSRMRKVRTCESHTLGGRSRTVTRVNVTQDSCGAYVAGALILRLSASADAERAPLLRRALFAAAPASQKPNPFTTYVPGLSQLTTRTAASAQAKARHPRCNKVAKRFTVRRACNARLCVHSRDATIVRPVSM